MNNSVAANHYDSNYGDFGGELYRQIRQDSFGEDIGQNSWLTSAEQDEFLSWLNLNPGRTLLDVGCGAGGPALRIAARTGCSIIGVDIHGKAIATANSLASTRGLGARTEFRVIAATERLPFSDESFDAVTCIDAINHLPDRPAVIADWHRLLKSDGRLVFTDPLVVTGPLTNSEIYARTPSGFYLLVPADYDEQVLIGGGFHVLKSQDTTERMAAVAEKRRTARAFYELDLRRVESDQAYESQQEFLGAVARMARECRLSRKLFLAVK